jgi:aryl-alcohol dehydrogenase-like predicted oxidoreductase
MIFFPSKIGLGTWQFSDISIDSSRLKDAELIFKSAYNLGVRHVDTAQSYGNGMSESVVGQIVKDFNDVFVATKIHFKPSASEAIQAVEESRCRLSRDTIDLVYLHWPRKGQDLRPVMEGLEKARSIGHIKYVGVSNFSVEQIEEVAEVSSVDAVQLCYNLLWRWRERDVIPYCERNNIAVVTYGALAQGLLAEKIKNKAMLSPDDPRLKTVFYDDEVFPMVLETVSAMSRAVAQTGKKLPQFALAWVLSRPGITATLLGARSPEQIKESVPKDLIHLMKENKVLEALTACSDRLEALIPDVGNIFRFYP